MIATLPWSVRRELWEHRWTYLVPLISGALAIAAFVRGSFSPAHDVDRMFDLLARIILITGTLVAFVYCGEALHGERRDRSILFWKSQPVSDGVVVMAKAAVAMLVIPGLTLALLFLAQLVARWRISGTAIVIAAPQFSPVSATVEVLVAVFWQAPVYGWILVVSGWARRAPLVAAFLPPILLTIVGRLLGAPATFGSWLSGRGPLRYWPMDARGDGVASYDMRVVPASTLIVSPALWVGVALTIVLLIAATQQRRRKQPI